MKKIIIFSLALFSFSIYAESCLKEIKKAGGNPDAVGSSIWLSACKDARKGGYDDEMGSCIAVMSHLGGHPDSIGSSIWIDVCKDAARTGQIKEYNECILTVGGNPDSTGSSIWVRDYCYNYDF